MTGLGELVRPLAPPTRLAVTGGKLSAFTQA